MERLTNITGIGIPQSHQMVDTIQQGLAQLPRRKIAAPVNRVQSSSTRWQYLDDGELTLSYVLREFCQNSSIHALRQLAEPSQYAIRRVFWTSILIVGFGIFLSQLVDSVNRYYHREVSVDLKVNYNKTLTFPAVTICNQNAFRATATNKLRIYDQISELYTTGHHINPNTLSIRGLPQRLSMSDLFLRAAHRKEDLILSCAFGSDACGHEDFVITPTDYGTCYTFNSGRERGGVRKIKASGIHHGLKLELNIEQYEYMPGPNTGAGLRFLVHSQNEMPLVRSLGMAVPSGSHAFVGVEIIKVNSLQPPYGECEDHRRLQFFPMYSQANCLSDCRERFIYQRCHCREALNIIAAIKRRKIPHSSFPGSPRACAVKEYVTCVVPVLRLFERLSIRCRCPVPCSKIIHDPVVTYGNNMNPQQINPLAKYMIAKDKNVRKIKRAKELALRHNAEYMTQYKSTFMTLISAYDTFYNLTDSLGNIMDNEREHFQDVALGAKSFFQLTLNTTRTVNKVLKQEFIKKWELLYSRSLSRVTSQHEDVLQSFSYILETDRLYRNGTILIANEFVTFLLDQKITAQIDLLNISIKRLMQFNAAFSPALKSHETFQCKYVIFRRIFGKSRLFARIKNKITALLGIIKLMQESLYKLDDAKKLLIAGQISIRQLRKGINNSGKRSRTFSPVLIDLTVLFEILKKESEMNTRNILSFKKEVITKIRKLEITHKILKEHNIDMKNNGRIIRVLLTHASTVFTNKNLTTSHSLRKTVAEDIARALQNTSLIRKIQYEAWDNEKHRLDLNNTLQNVWKYFEDSVFFNLLDSRMEEENTTLDCLSLYAPSHASHDLSSLYDMRKEFTKGVGNLKTAAPVQNTALTKVLRALDNESNILMKAFGHYKNYISRLEQDHIGYDFVRRLFVHHLWEPPNEILAQLKMKMNNLKKTEVTEGYNQIHGENYLRLDVFMRELNYEEITQQVTYDGNNLWGDIGGSIGLFVGASLITVFEAIDGFIFNAFRLIQGRSQVPKKKEHVHRIEK